jgi:hypothetical protein
VHTSDAVCVVGPQVAADGVNCGVHGAEVGERDLGHRERFEARVGVVGLDYVPATAGGGGAEGGGCRGWDWCGCEFVVERLGGKGALLPRSLRIGVGVVTIMDTSAMKVVSKRSFMFASMVVVQ